MNIQITTNVSYPQIEIRDTIITALKNEAEIAKFRLDGFRRLCLEFERKYGLSSAG